MKDGLYIAALDLGSHTIRLVVAEWTKSAYHIVGVGTAPAVGIKKGTVVDIEAVEQGIRAAADRAARMIDRPITAAVVGVGGPSVAVVETTGVVAVGRDDREIRQDDVDRVIEAAKIVHLPPDRVIVDVVPTAYAVDGLSGVRDPRGMLGMRLEVRGRLVSAAKTAIHNTLRALDRAEVEPLALVLPAFGAGWAYLDPDARRAGAVWIDMGAETTTVAVWQDGELHDLVVLPFGGAYLTRDIAHGLATSEDVAEGLKLKYGTSTVQEAADGVTFKVTPIGKSAATVVSQVELAEIIEPRLVEMLALIREALEERDAAAVPAGVAWSGGTVALPGFLTVAREIVHPESRLAVPDQIGVREPGYAASIGMIEYAVRLGLLEADPQAPRRRAGGGGSREAGFLAKVKSWLSELI
ncbi:cell division protein FtsA [Hydrogenibacillus sp. N12]|uniref:cell division protein FtsA n=1 Tax=Hydrogenibacillus sp. N12 TaxID=2866627 RepID=UPI001C7DDF18|nr:cell division protein FtsA [Hydrogenibacillus sp. N12]QZA33955.1 cell division protein FtsA [Hydrogenibacillus sp. N12]